MDRSPLSVIMAQDDPDRIKLLCNYAENNSGTGGVSPGLVTGAKDRLLQLCSNEGQIAVRCNSDFNLIARVRRILTTS